MLAVKKMVVLLEVRTAAKAGERCAVERAIVLKEMAKMPEVLKERTMDMLLEAMARRSEMVLGLTPMMLRGQVTAMAVTETATMRLWTRTAASWCATPAVVLRPLSLRWTRTARLVRKALGKTGTLQMLLMRMSRRMRLTDLGGGGASGVTQVSKVVPPSRASTVCVLRTSSTGM